MLTFIISLFLIGIVLFLFMFQMLKDTRKYSFRSSGISKRRTIAHQVGAISLLCIVLGVILIILNQR